MEMGCPYDQLEQALDMALEDNLSYANNDEEREAMRAEHAESLAAGIRGLNTGDPQVIVVTLTGGVIQEIAIGNEAQATLRWREWMSVELEWVESQGADPSEWTCNGDGPDRWRDGFFDDDKCHIWALDDITQLEG